MRRLTCSPRAENLLDIARTTIEAGQLDQRPDLVERFRATLAVAPQRGTQELGMGLCGRSGTRLAARLGEVTCEDCLALLGAPGGTFPGSDPGPDRGPLG